MRLTIISLLFLLLVQSALVAVLYWPQSDSSANTGPLLPPTNTLFIDEIRIADGMESEIVLIRRGGRWLLQDLQNQPADSGRIEALLSALTQPPQGMPVAENAAARQRFQVASYYFKRRLALFSKGEPLATVYLGRSPAEGMVYARNDKYPAIVVLSYSDHNATIDADTWRDRRQPP